MKSFLLMCVAVLLPMLCLLWKPILVPEHVMFSNDGPLGQLTAEQARGADKTVSIWTDLNWLGGAAPAHINATGGFRRVLETPFLLILSLCQFGGFCVVWWRHSLRQAFGCVALLTALLTLLALGWLIVDRETVENTQFIALPAYAMFVFAVLLGPGLHYLSVDEAARLAELEKIRKT